jgi:biopolymer transport protein ExbB
MGSVKRAWATTAFGIAALALCLAAAASLQAQAVAPTAALPAPPAATANAPSLAAPADAAAPQASLISTTDLWRTLRDGGPLMLAIAACSFLLVTFVLERVIQLRRGRVIPKPFVTRFLQQLGDGELDRDSARQLCEENGSPVAQVFAGAVKKWGRPGVEIEQSVIDAGERTATGLRRNLRLFYGISTVGPLLGLMGTVLGMIQTFNAIATHDALGRAELLAGGIAKALLNTAGGLAVAIPASICYVFFLSRADRLVIDIDALSQQVVDIMSADDFPRQIRQNKSRKAA